MIDIDEFVVLKKHDNIIDFMEEHCSEDCGQISLNWNMMTVSNETDYRPVPTLMRNIHSDHIWGTIKVIVRPSYVDTDRFDWWHSVRRKKGNWVDTTGKVIQRPNDGRNRLIMMLHQMLLYCTTIDFEVLASSITKIASEGMCCKAGGNIPNAP
jgi:hypothetical protein